MCGQSLFSSFPSKSCENEGDPLNSPGQGQQHQQLWQWEVRASAGPAAACLDHTQQQGLFCLCSPSSQCIHDPSAASQHIPHRTEPSRVMAQPWCLPGAGALLSLPQQWDALHSAGQSCSSDEHHLCAPQKIPEKLRMEMAFPPPHAAGSWVGSKGLKCDGGEAGEDAPRAAFTPLHPAGRCRQPLGMQSCPLLPTPHWHSHWAPRDRDRTGSRTQALSRAASSPGGAPRGEHPEGACRRWVSHGVLCG